MNNDVLHQKIIDKLDEMEKRIDFLSKEMEPIIQTYEYFNFGKKTLLFFGSFIVGLGALALTVIKIYEALKK